MGVWGVFRGSVGWGRGTEKGLLLSNQILDNPHPSKHHPRQPLPLIPSPDELSGPGAVSTFVLGGGGESLDDCINLLDPDTPPSITAPQGD